MPHAIVHLIKGESQDEAQTPGERNEALGLLAFCWLLAAGVFIAVKWAGTYTPPWTLVFFRMLFATLFLLPFVASHYREMASRLRDHFWVILPIGALGLALTQGALFTALHHSSAINVGIVFSVWPITAVILAALFLGDRLTLVQVFGVILCFCGVLVVVARGNPDTVTNMDFNTGDLLVIAAVACFFVLARYVCKIVVALLSVCPVMLAISGIVQPASDSRVTAVPAPATTRAAARCRQTGRRATSVPGSISSSQAA